MQLRPKVVPHLAALCCALWRRRLHQRRHIPSNRSASLSRSRRAAAPTSSSRIVAQKLTIALGQTVIVDNRPGAGGMIGTELVARSPSGRLTHFS